MQRQNSDDDFGKPDNAIKFDDTFILIESKVELIERTNQLEDYLRILLKDETSKKKHLIYHT